MTENSVNKLFTLAAAGESFGLDMVGFSECSRWIISQLHPAGAFCPHCSAMLTDSNRLEKFYRFEQIRCPECAIKFTAATGTMLNGSKLEIREIYILAVFSNLGVSAQKIASILKIHVDSVRNWQAKFKAHQELAGV